MILKPASLKNSIYLIILIVSLSSCGFQYEWVYQGHAVKGTHSRGLYLKDTTITVAGAKGVYSTYNLKGEQLIVDSLKDVADIRDVMQFEDGSWSLMEGSENSSITFVEANGDQKRVYKRSNSFIDGFDFWDDKAGFAYGDPLKGRFYLLETMDGGRKWNTKSKAKIGLPQKGEAGFAASGTGIQCLGDSTVVFGTGGIETPRLHVSQDRGESWSSFDTPIVGGQTAGIYSLFFWSETEGIIIGGDYLKPEDAKDICYKTSDQGKSWVSSNKGLDGYCSTIQGRDDGKLLIASGRIATYYSLDKGKSWKKLSDDKYYSSFVTDDYVIFSGRDGVLGILKYEL